MNHIYRVIFNQETGTFQAVSEIVKTTRKSHSSKGGHLPKILLTPLSVAVTLLSSQAFASPTGGQVTAGVANIAQTGNITNINQSSQNAAINWQSFNVGKNETVNFNQPNAQSVTLNRVIGNERSVIDGAMNASGKVFISNANGMLIGKDAKINVGSLVATTANISDDDLMNGRYQFTGEGAGSIENLGHISVPKGGVVALVAPIVKNGGTITAHESNVLLASAESFSITLPDNANFKYTLDKGTLQGLVDNGGAILADAGRVVLTAKGVDTVKKSLIKHSGKIEANTVQNKNGVIELLGDLDNSALNVSGSLKAEAKESGDGGFIETSASQVRIEEGAEVSTLAENGKTGTWLIDPQDFTVYAGNGEKTDAGIGAETLNQNLQATDIVIETVSEGSEKGDIYVNAPVFWNNNRLTLSAHNNIYINENLNGSGNARLELKYGQASENAIQADGTESDYYIQKGKKIDLPTGQNLVVQRGSSSDNARRLTVLHSLPNDGRLFPKYVALGTDLNLSGQPFTQGLNGVELFHGLGHEIDGLEIDHTQNMSGQSPEHIGFIPNLSGGIRDLTLNNVNIKTQINDDCDGNCNEPIGVGALIGRAGDATIKNVYVSGKMSDLGNYDNVKMGGLIGIADGRVRVINSHADVNIEKQEQTQANELVGLDNGGLSVENSQGRGNITNIEPAQPVNPPAPTTPPAPTQPVNPSTPVTPQLQPVPTPQPTTQPVIPAQPVPTTPQTPQNTPTTGQNTPQDTSNPNKPQNQPTGQNTSNTSQGKPTTQNKPQSPINNENQQPENTDTSANIPDWMLSNSLCQSGFVAFCPELMKEYHQIKKGIYDEKGFIDGNNYYTNASYRYPEHTLVKLTTDSNKWSWESTTSPSLTPAYANCYYNNKCKLYSGEKANTGDMLIFYHTNNGFMGERRDSVTLSDFNLANDIKQLVNEKGVYHVDSSSFDKIFEKSKNFINYNQYYKSDIEASLSTLEQNKTVDSGARDSAIAFLRGVKVAESLPFIDNNIRLVNTIIDLTNNSTRSESEQTSIQERLIQQVINDPNNTDFKRSFAFGKELGVWAMGDGVLEGNFKGTVLGVSKGKVLVDGTITYHYSDRFEDPVEMSTEFGRPYDINETWTVSINEVYPDPLPTQKRLEFDRIQKHSYGEEYVENNVQENITNSSAENIKHTAIKTVETIKDKAKENPIIGGTIINGIIRGVLKFFTPN